MDHLGFSEVIPDHCSSTRWKYITVNIGAAQSTLQDIKFPEASGAYQFGDGSSKNRFIYWRIKHDIVEFVEESMDYNLSGNHVKFQFQDTPIIEGGVSIHENHGFVVILIATVASVHRLLFPHPRTFSSTEFSSTQSNLTLASIFCDVSVNMTRDKNHFYSINNGNSGSCLPHTSASWLSNDGVAYFALANNLNSNILLVIMGFLDTLGKFFTHELKQTSVMQRLWTGFVPSFIRGSKENDEVAVSMFIHPCQDDVLTFALGRDAKLRMWSNRSLECVMCTDILPKNYEDSALINQGGAQKHMLKKAVGIDSKGCLQMVIGIFFCFSDQKLFCLLKPTYDTNCYNVEVFATHYCPVDWDLIDFSLTVNRLWAMWSQSDSQPVVKYVEFQPDCQSEVSKWKEVSLVPNLNREAYLAEGLEDLRQAYLKEIFHPRRFSTLTINKAISIFRKTSDVSTITTEFPENALMQEVINVIENEVQHKTTDDELVDDIYLEIQNESWSKFYSCCVEYHEVGVKPTGITAFDGLSMAIVIKKDHFSVLRTVDNVEYLYKTGSNAISTELISPLSPDPNLLSAIKIIECLHIISQNLNDDIKEAFKHDIYHLQNPDTIAQTILDNVICPQGLENSSDTSIVHELTKERCSNMSGALNAFLQMIDFTDLQDALTEAGENCNDNFVNYHWMNSNLGTAVMCNSIEQLITTRFEICRDLLLFQLILLQYKDDFQLSQTEVNNIQTETLPKICLLTQSYYVLLWASQTEVDSISLIQRGFELQHPTVLEYPEMYIYKPRIGQRMTVLELFVRGEGGRIARKLENDGNQFFVPSTFIKFMKSICCFIWPISSNFLFPEFLMMNFQYLKLQEYIRLLQTWCKWNLNSRKFMLGYSFLNQGEHDKAVDCFLKAADGVTTDNFLFRKFLQIGEGKQSYLTTFYCLKVIRLLEQFNVADQILTVANKAVNKADKCDPNVATLLSIVFRYHLVLEHYDDAYVAMNSNPDSSIKKDCLREFVVVLCDRSQLKTLLGFSYENLYDDLVSIMESRARSVDLMQNNYYDMIYAFHVMRKNYRKAGSIMYEYGMRLGGEVFGVKGLQKQVKCYLTAMSALSLVNPKYAWIIKPVTFSHPSKEAPHHSDVYMKDSDDSENSSEEGGKRMIEVLELADIRREYKHATAILHLLRKSKDPVITSGPPLSPTESASFLVKEGLFDMAITLCTEYELPYNPIFEELTSRCVRASQRTDATNEVSSDWDWLTSNDAHTVHQASLNKSAAEQSWYLLKCYLEKYEKKGRSRYHRCIANKLLALGFFLPVWLVISYKKVNAAELLRLYLYYDQLNDAATLSLDYIDAVMGKGKDHFNLESSLSSSASAVWLPYSAFDQLLAALKLSLMDSELNYLHEKLREKLTLYQQMVSRVSADVLRYRSTTRS